VFDGVIKTFKKNKIITSLLSTSQYYKLVQQF